MRLILIFILLMFLSANAQNTDEDGDVAIGIEHDKHLGDTIPMELEFTNYTGDTNKLKDIIDKPTVLALVYYRCPGLCSPLMNNLGKVMDEVDLEPGKDFQALSISFDPSENHELAKDKRVNYINAMQKEIPDHAWRFMTGKSSAIDKLTNSVGFQYQRAPDSVNWVHSGAVIVLSPEGKITRYLLGTDYLPFDFKMAITEASKGVSSPPINKVLQYCFSYDPEGGSYVLNVNKIAGTVIFLGAGIFLAVLLIKGKRRKNKKQGDK